MWQRRRNFIFRFESGAKSQELRHLRYNLSTNFKIGVTGDPHLVGAISIDCVSSKNGCAEKAEDHSEDFGPCIGHLTHKCEALPRQTAGPIEFKSFRKLRKSSLQDRLEVFNVTIRCPALTIFAIVG